MIRETVRLALSDPRKLFDEHGKLKPIKDLGDDIAPTISSVIDAYLRAYKRCAPSILLDQECGHDSRQNREMS